MSSPTKKRVELLSKNAPAQNDLNDDKQGRITSKESQGVPPSATTNKSPTVVQKQVNSVVDNDLGVKSRDTRGEVNSNKAC